MKTRNENSTLRAGLLGLAIPGGRREVLEFKGLARNVPTNRPVSRQWVTRRGPTVKGMTE